MDNFHVYKDIEARTGGEIYIGVVGPVRTGKSTFIKRFMELMVLPGMNEGQAKAQARDELPQSAKTALITVGYFLGSEYDRSELYNPTFAHGYREADPSKLDIKPEVK